jgi:hypothetical protein
MAQLPEVLEWYSLTSMINEMKSPQAFLRNLLFSDVESQPTENIVYSVMEGRRNVAPFVKKNSQAIMSGGYTEKEITITPPNIRLKRPVEAADVIFRRHAGDSIFVGEGNAESARDREVARQVQRLEDEIANAEEYLCSLAIQGEIAYSTADEDHFTITFPKPAGNTITLTDFWDQTGDVAETVMTARRQMHDEVSLQPTHCILGEEAADTFIKSASARALLDIRNLQVGAMDLTSGIGGVGSPLQGAMFLGSVFGIQFWAYHPSVYVNGSATALIRAKYAEFVHAGPAARNTLYYGAISDLDALDQRLLSARRFSKSWIQPDPSVLQLLVASRPLPVPRRPGSIVSVKVVSG